MQGKSPTCYSPVRHSSTPEGAFPFDLHVLSTPPAFVLSQDQTLQTKTPTHKTHGQNSNQRKPDKTNKNNHTPTRGIKAWQKTTTKPPNTLLSSQTTPLRPRNKSHGSWPVTRLRTSRDPPKWFFPLGHRRALRPGR